MAIIYSYPNGGSAIASDKLTISRSSLDAPIPNPTFTLTVAQIAAFVQNQLASGTPNYIPVFNTANSIIDSPMFLDDFAAPTLLTIGVDAVMSGGLTVTGASVFNNTSEFWGMTTFEDVASFQNAVYDETSTPGTSGQILSSTGSAVRWIDPALTGVGTIGKIPVWVGTDELGDSIMSTLGGNTIEVAGNMTVQGIEVNTTFTDGAGSTGSPGQVLTSTGTETAWVGGSTGTVSGGGTTNTLPLWTDGPNDVIGDSQLNQVGPNANGVYQIRMQNTDRFIIDKPSSVTSGDPEYSITQDGNFKVSMGWDDDGTGFGYLYNWAGDGWRFGSAGNNPELTIVTTAGSEGVDIANDLRINGNAIAFGDLTIENGLIDGDFTYGTAGQVLSTTGSGQNVKWVDTTTGAFKEVNEGNGLGIVKQSRNPNNYAPVGNEAFDASQSTSVSSTKGAEGDYSVALGLDVYARGDHSFAFGETSRAFNDWDIVMGHDSEAVGGNSVALGWEAKAQGAVSTAIGSFVTASGDNSIAFGTRLTATGSESNVFGKYNATTNELFVVGNGNNSTPSDLIVGKENGVILAPSLDILEIVDPKCLVTLEYLTTISSGIIGTGTESYIPRWINGTPSTTLSDSVIRQDDFSAVIIGGSGSSVANSKVTVYKADDMTASVPHIATFNDSLSNHSANLWPSPGDNSADIYGSVSRGKFTGSGTVEQIIGANNAGSSDGSGGCNFIQGALNTAKINGSGTAQQIIAGYNSASVNGTAAVNIPYVQGTRSQVDLNGENDVDYIYGNFNKIDLTKGTVNEEVVANYLDIDQVAADTVVKNAYYIKGNTTDLTVTGEKLFIKDISGLDSEFGASLKVADSLEVGANVQATGTNSVAMGDNSIASGLWSTAMGGSTRADGANSTAMGASTTASGQFSTAMGFNTIASGIASTAMGDNSTASGFASTAMGNTTTADGDHSTAMGYQTTASGDNSTAMGHGTIASGNSSTAMGQLTTASGDYSAAIGYDTEASAPGSFAGGGLNGAVPFPGGKASGNSSFAFGLNAVADSAGNIAIGSNARSTGQNSVAIGNQLTSEGANSTAMGTNTFASGNASMAIGAFTIASNQNSFATGNGTQATGRSSTAMGVDSIASGQVSISIGNNTTASGDYSFAAGSGNTASGNGSIVMGGVGTGVSTASGEASAVFGGLQNNAAGINSTIIGGQKNDIDVNSNDSSILGGEDNAITAGSKNSILLGGIGLRGGGIHQTTCGVANVSRDDAKFVVGVGTYTDPTNITRENGFVVKDDGQIVLDQYRNNDFLDNSSTFPVLNIDGTGRVHKGDLPELLSSIPTKLTVDTGTPLSSGSNINLASDASTVIGFDWAGGPGLGLVTLPQSSNNYGKVITVFTMDGYGSVANTNRLGVKPGFGDSINGVNAPAVAIELDKAYESAEFIATGIGWVLLRSTIL